MLSPTAVDMDSPDADLMAAAEQYQAKTPSPRSPALAAAPAAPSSSAASASAYVITGKGEITEVDPDSDWVRFSLGDAAYYWNDETDEKLLQLPAGVGIRETEDVAAGDDDAERLELIAEFEQDYTKLRAASSEPIERGGDDDELPPPPPVYSPTEASSIAARGAASGSVLDGGGLDGGGGGGVPSDGRVSAPASPAVPRGSGSPQRASRWGAPDGGPLRGSGHLQIVRKDSGAWTPDDDKKACEQCGRKFSARRRRHHCRLCGGLFCSACCSQKLDSRTLPDAAKPIRTCGACFEAAREAVAAGARAPPSPSASPSKSHAKAMVRAEAALRARLAAVIDEATADNEFAPQKRLALELVAVTNGTVAYRGTGSLKAGIELEFDQGGLIADLLAKRLAVARTDGKIKTLRAIAIVAEGGSASFRESVRRQSELVTAIAAQSVLLPADRAHTAEKAASATRIIRLIALDVCRIVDAAAERDRSRLRISPTRAPLLRDPAPTGGGIGGGAEEDSGSGVGGGITPRAQARGSRSGDAALPSVRDLLPPPRTREEMAMQQIMAEDRRDHGQGPAQRAGEQAAPRPPPPEPAAEPPPQRTAYADPAAVAAATNADAERQRAQKYEDCVQRGNSYKKQARALELRASEAEDKHAAMERKMAEMERAMAEKDAALQKALEGGAGA